MVEKLLLDSKRISIMIQRLSRQLLENHSNFSESVLVGLQPRGIAPTQKIKEVLERELGHTIPTGYLDATFYRDDFRTKTLLPPAAGTQLPFLIEQKKVVVIDDVLYTGRSVRSALDALQAYGRPSAVELLVMVDRMYSRELPINATYIGTQVNSVQGQRVRVEWTLNGAKSDAVWLVGEDNF